MSGRLTETAETSTPVQMPPGYAGAMATAPSPGWFDGVFTTGDLHAMKQVKLTKQNMKNWLEAINPAYGEHAGALLAQFEYTDELASATEQDFKD